MSYQIKNVSLKDGFAKNPDRYYCEEFFNQLPLSTGEFIIANGDTDFTLFQPPNTLLKEIHVVCHTAPTLAAGGNVGISVGTQYQALTSGEIVAGTTTNLISNTTTLAINTLITLSLESGATIKYSSGGRSLFCRVTSSQAPTSGNAGKFFVIPVFIKANSSNYIGLDNFIITGTNAHTPSFDGTNGYSGVKLTTSAAANDQAILFPNVLAGTSISNGLFKTGSKLEFETSVVFPTIPGTIDYSFVAGLKLTSTPLVATDATQAMFIFGNSTPLVGGSTLASTTNILFVYSIGGTDYITNLGLPIVADRVYHLKIKMNKQEKLCVYVNGIQFGLTSTSGSMGTLATNSYDESVAITNAVSLYPIVGIQIASTTARSVVVNYIKLSRETKKV
jgi:hypothetical protein